MTRTSLDDAQWVSLMLVMQQIPLVWKRDDVALRRFVEAALWIMRSGYVDGQTIHVDGGRR